jgi:hypothetical protein
MIVKKRNVISIVATFFVVVSLLGTFCTSVYADESPLDMQKTDVEISSGIYQKDTKDISQKDDNNNQKSEPVSSETDDKNNVTLEVIDCAKEKAQNEVNDRENTSNFGIMLGACAATFVIGMAIFIMNRTD